MTTTAKEMDAADLTEPEMTSVVSSSFIESIKSLLEEGTLSDVNLRAGSQLFPAHKCILSACSPVFKAMFNGNFKEKMSKCIEISDVDGDTLKELLSYIYTDKVGELQWRGAADLYRAADKYQLLDLKRRCANLLKSNLSISNVCAIMVVADMHYDRQLREATQDFVMRQGADFFTSDTWQSFKEENSKLAWEVVEPVLCYKINKVDPIKSGTCSRNVWLASRNDVNRVQRQPLHPDVNAEKKNMKYFSSNDSEKYSYSQSHGLLQKSNLPSSADSIHDITVKPKHGSKRHRQNQMNKFKKCGNSVDMKTDNFVDVNNLYIQGQEKSDTSADVKFKKHLSSKLDRCKNSTDFRSRGLIQPDIQSKRIEKISTSYFIHSFSNNSVVDMKKDDFVGTNELYNQGQKKSEISPENMLKKHLSPNSDRCDNITDARKRILIQTKKQHERKEPSFSQILQLPELSFPQFIICIIFLIFVSILQNCPKK